MQELTTGYTNLRNTRSVMRGLDQVKPGNDDAAFEPLARERPHALLVTTNPVFESRRDQIVALAARYAVPAIYGYREYPASGGLMSYGASISAANLPDGPIQPLCEALSSRRGLGPHHAQMDRVGTWDISRLAVSVE